MEVISDVTRSKTALRVIGRRLKSLFIKKSETHLNSKSEFNFKTLKIFGALFFIGFIVVVLLIPDHPPMEFREIGADTSGIQKDSATSVSSTSSKNKQRPLWSSPSMPSRSTMRGNEINYDTPMLIGQSGGSAKTQLRAGSRVQVRLLDKTVIAQDPVPVMVSVEIDAITESGLKLPQGSKLYGEASFEKGSGRARIHFTQASLPSGELKNISGSATDREGQVGITGRVFSEGMKNTAGQLMTTFIAGLATGSMRTNFLGASQGGLRNGVLSAVGQTAHGRAQAYGEKLKTEREWMELKNGMEFEAVLNDSLNLQEQRGTN